MSTKALSAPSGSVSDASLASITALPTGGSMLVGDTVITFPNDGNTLLFFHAGASSTLQPTPQDGSTAPTARTAASGSTYVLGPFDPGVYNDASGLCHIAVGTGNASHTAVVVKTHLTNGARGSRHNAFAAEPSTARDA